MNINDVTEKIEIPKNIWAPIFHKQMELALKYKDIEKMGDLLETTANNIDTAKGQKWIKDFAWRVTEELAEAFEAFQLLNDHVHEEDVAEQYKEHIKEEHADALHFLVELSLIAGYDYRITDNLISSKANFYSDGSWEIIYQLGLLCNTLKNKPWKQTQMLTDRPKFEKYLKASWQSMYNLLKLSMETDANIYTYYFKKNKVNQFRQRSKY